MQSASTILMVRPFKFLSNPETRTSNAFQNPDLVSEEFVTKHSLEEFDNMVHKLLSERVTVIVFQDPGEVFTPDSLFPNNWISFHDNGSIILYPMQAPNRRLERRTDQVLSLLNQNGIHYDQIIDLTYFERQSIFLEGTGSMVLDRENKIAFACLSPRTDLEALKKFSEISGYSFFAFHAYDKKNQAIYHTNVMMCIGTHFILACLESIQSQEEKKSFLDTVNKTGKSFIEISLDQMNHFAGNMLEVKNELNESLIILSKQAFDSLFQNQKDQLNSYARMVPISLDIIEKNGGGSARCMMAEIHFNNLN